MATRKPRTRWPRRAWTAGEITPALSDEARQSLVDANRGFVAEPRLDELERELRILVREPERLDASVKTRRAELREVTERIQALRAALGDVHPRSMALLVATLVEGWTWKPDIIPRLVALLGTLRMACAQVLAEMPTAGRPHTRRRDAVGRAVAAWVDSLEPTPTPPPAATTPQPLSREAGREPLMVPLRANRGGGPGRRRQESATIVLAALGFPAVEITRCLRRILKKQSA